MHDCYKLLPQLHPGLPIDNQCYKFFTYGLREAPRDNLCILKWIQCIFPFFWHQDYKCCTHLYHFQVAQKESYGVRYRPPSSSTHRCVQHMKTIRLLVHIYVTSGFYHCGCQCGEYAPRVNGLKSKVQCQSYLLCNLVYRGLSTKVIPANIPTHRYQSSRPPYLSVFVFLVHLKKKKGKKIAGRGIEEGVIWNCLLNIIPPANVAWPLHGTQFGKRQVSLEAETHPRPLQHTFLI